MLVIRFFPLALLGAWMSPEAQAEPVVRVVYGDLALGESAGRAVLRERVAKAAAEFCKRHGRDVTPGEIRLDRSYCTRMLHVTIVDAMPRRVRNAYGRALREGEKR